MHTHIALVGRQTLPIYKGIRFLKPDRVIFVCSEGEKGSISEGERLRHVIGLPSQFIKISPSDLEQIDSTLERFIATIPSGEAISINLQGGTTHWSLMFYKKFLGYPNVTFYLIDQNDKIYNLNTLCLSSFDEVVDLETQLTLNGHEMSECNKIDDYCEEDKRAMIEVKRIRKFNFEDFNKITLVKNELKNNFENNVGTFSVNSGSMISWNRELHKVNITLVNKNGIKRDWELSSPMIMKIVFNAGWFEYEIAQNLKRWTYAKLVLLNVKFKYQTGKVKNEVDILVYTGDKLLFVECKTAIFDITNISKFKDVVALYGGGGSKSLFVTEFPMRQEAVERCADTPCVMTFSLFDKDKTYSSWSDLFAKLEQELLVINK